jgi:hypothetical protein
MTTAIPAAQKCNERPLAATDDENLARDIPASRVDTAALNRDTSEKIKTGWVEFRTAPSPAE